ncbi:MAG: branched-chain amino acid ABC transporter substrate-binding protein, partial [Tabrizicola sp.]
MIRATGLIAAMLVAAFPARAEVVVEITWLRLEVVLPPVLSNLDRVPEDLGLAGAELGIADNTTTGSFLGHDYRLTTVSVPPDGDITAAARDALARSQLLVLDAEAAATLAVADL